MGANRFYPGLKATYFPRAYGQGHEVTIVSVCSRRGIPRVRFRYSDGREREVTCSKFHTEYHVKE